MSLSLALVQTWNLMDVEAPAGTRDPLVVHSGNEARAVLIVLNPGQEMGDHQVPCTAYRLDLPRGRAFLPQQATHLGVPREAWKSAIWACIPRAIVRTKVLGEVDWNRIIWGFLRIVGSWAVPATGST